MHTLILLIAACGGPETTSLPGCEDPEPILNPAGEPSGYVLCADGSRDRVASMPLDLAWYADALQPCASPSEGVEHDCFQDADCGADPLARCVCERTDYSYQNINVCTVVCERDEDCAAGEVCVGPEQGGSPWGVPGCHPADCLGPEDCAGGECGATWYGDYHSSVFTSACRDAGDSCRAHAECADFGWSAFCVPQPVSSGGQETAWACEQIPLGSD